MKFIADNITKILGSIQTALMAMIAAGAFEGLMDSSAIRWLGILGTLVGAATTAVGFNNSTKARVAEAMETAIMTQPPAQPTITVVPAGDKTEGVIP